MKKEKKKKNRVFQVVIRCIVVVCVNGLTIIWIYALEQVETLKTLGSTKNNNKKTKQKTYHDDLWTFPKLLRLEIKI